MMDEAVPTGCYGLVILTSGTHRYIPRTKHTAELRREIEVRAKMGGIMRKLGIASGSKRMEMRVMGEV